MSDRWDSLNGTGYWMVGPVDDLSDESFLEDAARSYNMDQVATLDGALLNPSEVYLLKVRFVDCISLNVRLF